jgi:hypothetical protein
MFDTAARSDAAETLIRPSLWPGLAMPCFCTIMAVCQAMAADWAALAGQAPVASGEKLLIVNAVGTLMVLLTAWIAATRYGVRITKAGVQGRDSWGRRHFVAWDQVQHVETTGGIRLTSATDSVTIPEAGFLSSWKRLSDIVGSHLPAPGNADGLPRQHEDRAAV